MKTYLLACFALCGISAIAAPSVSLPPFTITGRIVNANRQSVSEVNSGNAEIRAYKSDGTLIARSPIVTEKDFTENYRLVVPLASGSSPAAASVGEKLSFQVQQQNLTYSVQDIFTLDSSVIPGGVAVMNVVAASDTDHDGVADEYERLMNEQIAFYKWYDPDRYGGLSDTYDKNADYDGDGISNFKDYVAGTNPFDERDAFKVLSFRKSDTVKGHWELTFFANRDRAYTMEQTRTLGSAERPFARGGFAEGAATSDERSVLHIPAAETGVRIIFVLPDEAGAASQFFRLKVQ